MIYKIFFALCAVAFLSQLAHAQDKGPFSSDDIEKKVLKLMDEGDIPGISLVMIQHGREVIKNYGFSDAAAQRPITKNTLFELGSCSKAFTALAVTKLLAEGKLHMEDDVSEYIPWLVVYYEDSAATITIEQLLHHTSGIPWNTISKIPATNAQNALETTVRQLIGQELREDPGKEYEYATINYDILAYVVQVVTGEPFESYLEKDVFEPLRLDHTTIGIAKDNALKAEGFKIGFFAARQFDAPVFKGNNAAGYVISDAHDIAKWMRFHMGLDSAALYPLAQRTHARDETVPLHRMNAYARGWEVSLNGTNEIFHGGLNPNFTSYIAFRPREQVGIAVLANSNSGYTELIGDTVLKMMLGEDLEKELVPRDTGDKAYSMLFFAVVLYVFSVLAFIGWIVVGLARGDRSLATFRFTDYGRFFRSLLFSIPFLYGLYLVPVAIAGFSWEMIFVWMPVSFYAFAVAVGISIAVSYLAYFLEICFPEKNEYKRMVPPILLMSILSGVANVVVIIMVTSALDSDVELKYLVFYYVLTICMYLFGRRFVQISLIKFARGIIYDLRIQLIDKIFSTSYQRFERIDRGRVYTALNDDVNTIGASSNTIVMFVTSVITALGAFIFLASIAFWAALITIGLIVSLAAVYYFVVRSTNVYYEQARDSRNVFVGLISGMIDGFKEISLQRNKKIEYKADVAVSANEYRRKISTADIRFTNAFLIGESLLVVLLGAVSLGMPELFPNVRLFTVLSFIMILLYLIGPINGILTSVPALMQLKIAWNRVHRFLSDIPANLDLRAVPEPIARPVTSIRAENVRFRYKGENGGNVFSVGPINLEASHGEIIFIIGGNGSGKTTLAKLFTGLYEPDEGAFFINGKDVRGQELSQHFSTVFSPVFIFDKLYNVDVSAKGKEIGHFLDILNLSDKVKIEGNRYSTTRLSGGQRKRLALLQCYLEDSPIYLFDEWAADQDPDYRHFFYRTLLPEMKRSGKIVIAITHDDHYFDVADKVMKMSQGVLEVYDGKTPGRVVPAEISFTLNSETI
jgi:cyclic peptide transporter